MKQGKRAVLGCLFGVLAAAVLGACSSTPQNTVATVELTQEEQTIATAASDIFVKYQLEPGRTYEVAVTSYRNGLQQQRKTLTNLAATEENNTLLLSGYNTEGINYSWIVTAPGERVTCPAPGFEDDGSTNRVKIQDIGQSDLPMEAGQEYLLYYVAYKAGASTLTISEKPFHEWNTVTDKDTLLQDFDCAYLITISVAA